MKTITTIQANTKILLRNTHCIVEDYLPYYNETKELRVINQIVNNNITAKFVVYLGDKVKIVTTDIELAVKEYNKL